MKLKKIKKTAKNHVRACMNADASNSKVWDDSIHRRMENSLTELQCELEKIKKNVAQGVYDEEIIEAETALSELAEYAYRINKL